MKYPAFEGWVMLHPAEKTKNGDVFVWVSEKPNLATSPETGILLNGRAVGMSAGAWEEGPWRVYRRTIPISRRIIPSSTFSKPLPLP